MNLVVFGASGKTGREVVTQAIAQGHVVTAFVRTPGRLTLTHMNLKVKVGDVLDARVVERAITGQHAVFCCLGAANPLAPYPAFTTGVQHIIHGMGLAAVRRLIYLSTIGAGESRDSAGFFVRQIVARIIRGAMADHTANERAIRQSRLDWTIVHAPRLTSGPRTGRFRSGEAITPGFFAPSISRADVADFMLRQLMDTTFVRKAPTVLP